MINRNKWTPEFVGFFDKFVKTDEWNKMANTVEDSPWHREENVAKHTCMVLDAAELFNPFDTHKDQELTRTDKNILAISLLFHDTGKPAAKQIVDKVDENGNVSQHTRFSGHEQKSARVFNAFYFENMEWFEDFKFTRAQIVFIQWLIQNHLPYDSIAAHPAKYANSILGMSEFASVHPALFVCHLYADNKGRVSDEDHPSSGLPGDVRVKQTIDLIKNNMKSEYENRII